MSEQSKSLIPRSFQHPNSYIDWLAYYLTPEEEKVLNKAIREIYGWHNKIADRRSRIALSVFVGGKVHRETGEQVCLGCGLGMTAVRKALEKLDEYNILIKEGKPTNDGQMYRIQDNFDKIDIDGLKARRNEACGKSKDRTATARVKLAAKRAKEQGFCGTKDKAFVGQTAGVLSDNNKETQETQEETQSPAQNAGAPAPEPAGKRPESTPTFPETEAGGWEDLMNFPIDPPRESDAPVPRGTPQLPPPCSYDIHITQYADELICPFCEEKRSFDPKMRRSDPFRKDPHCSECGAQFRIYLETDHGDSLWAEPKARSITREYILGNALPGWKDWLAGICKGEKIDPAFFEGWMHQCCWSKREFQKAESLWRKNADGFLRKLVWSYQEYKARRFRATEWISKAIAAYHTKEMKRNVDSSPPAPPGESYVPF